MAVFKPDLSWTTLQEKQLQELESFNTNLLKSLKLGKDASEKLEEIADSNLKAAHMIIYGINAIWNGADFENLLVDISTSSIRQEKILEDTKDTIKDTAEDAIEEMQKTSEENQDRQKETQQNLSELMDSIKDLAGRAYDAAAQSANEYSNIYNDIIKFTGADKDSAQQFRRNVMNQISDINSGISKIDPQQALETVVAISNSTNISNRETLEMLTAPIISAQETTNMNIAELSKLGARFYTKYNFQSEDLSELVNTIRSSSEGQNINEDKILEYLDKVELRAGLKFQDDTDTFNKFNEGLVHATSYFESLEIDPTEFVEDINKMMSTDPRERASVVGKYHGDYDEILQLLDTGKSDEAMMLMAEHLSKLSTVTATSLSNDAFDSTTAELIQQWAGNVKSGKYVTYEQFLEGLSKDTAADRLDDKFVNIQDQISNKLSEIGSYLATIQETVGIGFTDVGVLYLLAKDNLPKLKGLGDISSILGGTGARTVSGGQGIAGLLSSAGPALGIGAGIAIIGGTVASVLDTLNDVEDALYKDKSEALNEGINATEQEASNALGYMYKSSYNGNEKTWEQVLVDKSEYMKEDGTIDTEKFYQDQLAAQQEYNKDLQEDAVKADNFWVGLLDVLTLGISSGIRGSVAKSQTDTADQFNKLAQENIGSELWQTYWNNDLLSDDDMQAYFVKNYDKIVDLYKNGKVMLTSGDDKGDIIDTSQLASYDVGTNYVPEDQLAYLHKGEAVVPARYNPANNTNELNKVNSANSEESNTDLSAIIDLLSGIQNYLQYWKSDNDRKDSRNMTTQRANLLSYLTQGGR